MSKEMFSIDLDNINVEDIMKQIKEKIKEQNIIEEHIEIQPIEDKDSMASEHLRLVNLSHSIIIDKPITSHRRGVGKLIIFAKKVIRKVIGWYIRPMMEQQNEFNAHVTRTLNSMDIEMQKMQEEVKKAINNIDKSLKDTKMQELYKNKLSKLVEQIASLEKQLQLQDNYKLAIEEKIQIYNEQLREIDKKTDSINLSIQEKTDSINLSIQEKTDSINLSIQEKTDSISLSIQEKADSINLSIQQQDRQIRVNGKEIEALHNYLERLNNEQNGVLAENNFINSRVKRIERKLKYSNLDILEPQYKHGELEKIDFDYFMFEEKYRGSQQEIKKRLEAYLPYFIGQQNIIDIGCGRGEFLEILKENNVEAQGVEIDEDMIMICKEKNLQVHSIDALAYLKSIEDNSLGGMILTQVIEHLTPNYLIELIHLAYRKLKPGANFVAETINPQSLIVFTEAYFMDLSHIRMIHPLTIKFLLESEGFKNINTEYLSKVGEDLRLPAVEELPVEFNQALTKLNDVVYGYRDYAVIGRK